MNELLKKLVQAESTAAVGEVGAAKVLSDYFNSHNIDCEVDVWDETRANATVHVKSSGEKPALLFAAHIDVVPAGERSDWDCEPFEALEKDGKVFGRGSCDMKGGTAATAAAIAEIVSEGHKLKGEIIFTSAAGEETSSCGIKRFAEHAGDLGEVAGIIIPEPTKFDIVIAHRGILWLKVQTAGKTAHGSMPHLGINAIKHMNSLLNALEGYLLPHVEHPKFGKCSMSINQIHGGCATNVVPDSCSIELDIRTLPGQTHESIIGDLQRVCDELKVADSDFVASIEVMRSVEGLETDGGCEFVKEICSLTGIGETKFVGYATDGPFLSGFNAPTIIFGPGNTDMCHKPNEYIELADMERAKEYYKKIILHYLT
jgi:succinyl-diaminopimelate desuccinylase